MAEHFISLQKKVILVGRTESKLKEASSKLSGNPAYYVLDTGEVEKSKPVLDKILKEHPEVVSLRI